MPKQDRPLQVEALTYSDSFESLVDRHFRDRPWHRADDVGAYDVNKMVEIYQDKLFRSRQEYAVSPSGLTTRLQWASLFFKLKEDVFVLMFAKGNAIVRQDGGEEFKITVVAASPQQATDALAKLRKQFLPGHENLGPSFFIMTGGRRAQRASLEERHRLGKDLLALHYGDDFAGWTQEFMQGLIEPGISILCGETGTGKTSFIRHVMCMMNATHRFYFVPVDNFSLLASGSLTEFWKAEQRDHPTAAKVLVLEDAETLLRERDSDERNPVSSILNLTDGLMAQFIKVHLVATLNSKRDQLDKALLRPGRLRFFRNFERIPRERAERLAKHYGLKLGDRTEFSLAELFASEKFQSNTSGAVKNRGPIGFASK